MKTFIGIDVSLASSAFCVLDEHGQILKRAQVASEPEAFIAFFRDLQAGACDPATLPGRTTGGLSLRRRSMN